MVADSLSRSLARVRVLPSSGRSCVLREYYHARIYLVVSLLMPVALSLVIFLLSTSLLWMPALRRLLCCNGGWSRGRRQ